MSPSLSIRSMLIWRFWLEGAGGRREGGSMLFVLAWLIINGRRGNTRCVVCFQDPVCFFCICYYMSIVFDLEMPRGTFEEGWTGKRLNV